MTITLTVAGRIATVDATTHVVAGNTYPVALSLDSEWTGNLYLRVRFGSLYYDIPFASSATSVDVQMPVGYPEVGIGVFSEALEICTNEARVRLLRSILEAGEQVVEFDSDLYDQWAGEVTTLLTDDAFDAESTRPVQNAVLTAWKDTVPLDSALVHKTGDENIGGLKTFTSNLRILESRPYLRLRSSDAYDTVAWKNHITFEDVKDGAYSANTDLFSGNEFNYGGFSIRQSTPNRSAVYSLGVRAYADHMLVMESATFYPVDGQGNPQALTANALVTSGNVAVDPRLVHTSGIETIAGAKTFTSGLTIDNGFLVTNKTHVGYDYQTNYRRGVWEWYDKKDGADSMIASDTVSGQYGAGYNMRELKVYNLDRSTAYGLSILAYADHCAVLTNPYYPVDGSGNPQALTTNAVMTSGNVAVDPRIVHTTGNETVAGTKVFSGDVGVNRTFHRCLAGATVGSGWRRLYTFPVASSYARQATFIVRDDYNPKRLALRLAIRVNTPTGADYGFTDSPYLFKIARVDGHAEIWASKGNGGSSLAVEFDYATAGGFPTVSVSAEQAEPPTVGVDGCTAVVDVQAWS